jgi:low affinity Fe/Cu permease
MVFLIQNTQNRDAKAVQLKLDELIRSVRGARNQLMNLEEFLDEDLRKPEQQFQRVREHAEQRGKSTGVVPVTPDSDGYG